MDDSTDSAKDLFITQSSFWLDTNTQDAEAAASFFLDDDYDPTKPEVVKYLDFSKEKDTTYTVMTESQSQDFHKKCVADTVSLQHDVPSDNKVFDFIFVSCISILS